MKSDADIPVLVVGAGPVGLTLGCELRRHGIECRVVDEGNGPTPPHESRALGIHARTMEVFDDMGLAPTMLRHGRPIRAVNAYDGGRRFARLELDFHDLGSPYPFILSLAQGDTEQHLIRRLTELGGAVEWGVRLTGVRHDHAGVTAVLTGSRGDEQVRAGWLAGCDGARSMVRQCLGLSFEGAAYPEQFLLADVRLSWDRSPDEAHLLLTEGGLFPAIPLPDEGCWRLIDTTGEAKEDTDVGARLRKLLDAAGFHDAAIDELIWSSSFRIHRRAVNQLRVGRCFLAGDAAHIHSPVGGQGMNTGIQDAYNLAWKLGLAVAGTASDPLLDSYQAERLPIAAKVATATDRATRLVTLRNPLARAVRTRLAAWLSRSRRVRRRLTREISELGVNYRGSPIVAEHWLGKGGLKPGERVPDIGPLDAAGTRLFDILRGAKHTLLLFEGIADEPGGAEAVYRSLREERPGEIDAYLVVHESASASNDDDGHRIRDPDGRLHQLFGCGRASMYLIRPDGYVGLRTSPPAAASLASYFSKMAK